MPRKVFYSFYFDEYNWRAGQVRNMGILENDKPINGNRWEDVKGNLDYIIENWIETNLKDKSCISFNR